MKYVICAVLLFFLYAFFRLYRLKYPPFPKVIPGKRYFVCIGDSITYGAGVGKDRDTLSYPALLQTKMPDSVQVLNCGVNASTMRREGDRPYRKTGYLPKIIELQPERIFIMLGTNDSKPRNWDAASYEEEYRVLIQELRQQIPGVGITLIQPPKAFAQAETGVIAFTIQNDVITNEICPIIEKISREEKTGLIDLNTATTDRPELYMDGVHPNADGNRYLAEIIFQAVEE